MTQISASVMSSICERVRFMSPAKIEACCVIRNELNEMAKINPMYLARSPVSMASASQFMASQPLPGFSERIASDRETRTFRGLSRIAVPFMSISPTPSSMYRITVIILPTQKKSEAGQQMIPNRREDSLLIARIGHGTRKGDGARHRGHRKDEVFLLF